MRIIILSYKLNLIKRCQDFNYLKIMMTVTLFLIQLVLLGASITDQNLQSGSCQKIRNKPSDQGKSVWLDVDTGNDDSMAILTALFNDKLDLVGISTTFGNTGLEQATRNTIKMLSTFGFLDIPVIKGASKPLVKKHILEETMHGNLGMFGAEELTELFLPIIDDQEGIMSIYYYLKDHFLIKNQKTTFIVLGPHTNTARLLTQYPDVKDYITEIVFMGGCTGQGNISPYSEFNAFIDAEALKTVFDLTFKLQIKLTMVPLEVTEQVLIGLDHILDIKRMPGKFAQWVGSLIEKLRIATLAYGDPHPTLHDAIAVTYVVNPDLFESESYNIQINVDEIRYGQTEVIPGITNTLVLTKVDIPLFWNAFFKSVLQSSQHTE